VASIPSSAGLSFPQWAAAVITELASEYNLPNPVEEGLWQTWATELFHVPGLAERGLPGPASFGEDWRSWSAAFSLVMS